MMFDDDSELFGEDTDLVPEYQAYLSRLEAQFGQSEFGSFTKFQGVLIKKLTYDEFEPLFKQFQLMVSHYETSFERGDTIDNVVVRKLRETAALLVTDCPADG